MSEFVYKAKAPNGAILEGSLEAAEQHIAVDRLRSQKYIVLEIKEIKKNELAEILKKYNPFQEKVKSKDLVLFSRQLSTLVSAGVPIVQGLSILGEQISSVPFKKVVTNIREDIEGGISIADAMGRHLDVFSNLYVSMVRAGEIGGILDVILERLSSYLESSEKLKGKVTGALMYPAIVSVIAVVVTVFLLIVVIPTFKTIFVGFGAELPLPTAILLGISEFLQKYVIAIIVIPIILSIVFQRWYKTPPGQLVVDTYSLKLPVFGLLLKKVAVAKFTRTLGTLIKSGVPILQAMETVAKTAGNKVVENSIMVARESVREGERIADPLKKSKIFPPMVTQMIAVGEETGNLDIMLTKIADFYDEEVDVAVEAATSMIEPMVMCGMAVVIGAIVIAMFMPMFELGNLVSKAG